MTPATSAIGRRPSVLVADDDAATRALLSALVVEMGYPVVTAPDGEQAWLAYQDSPAEIVIADMSGIDGVALSRRIRGQVEDECFVMIVTSRDQADDLQVALGAGVDDYVTKPIVREHFRARLLIAERRLAVNNAKRAA